MKEIIVLGTGILGAATAFEMTKKNYKVTMIDSHEQGRATSAGAGIISPWVNQRRNKAWYTLAKNGAAHYKDLINELNEHGEVNTGYKQNGALHLHTNMDVLEKLKNIALKKREDAPEIGDVKILTNEETLAKFPLINENFSSVYVSGGARIDGAALKDALINSAMRKGATYIEGLASLHVKGNKVLGAKINGEVLLADTTVVTNGVWMPETLSPLNIHLNISMQKGQLIHLYSDVLASGNFPVVTPPRDPYIVPFDDGRVVVGATREDNATFDPSMTVGGVHEVLNKVLEIAPKFSESPIVEVRTGFRPFTKTFVPIFGSVPDYDRLYIANGLGASGLTTGPYIGKILADMVASEDVEIDCALYRVDEHVEKIK